MKFIQYEIVYRTEFNHWWYRVRRDLARKLIRIYAGTPGSREDLSLPGTDHGLKILDIGCGTGALMTELAPYGGVEGVDVSETAIAFCRERGITRVRQGSIEALPYFDGMFDVVLALDVLEHVRDDQAGIAEITRVLKPGGTAVIFSPAFMFLWSRTDELGEHVRRYTLPEMRAKLAEAGLDVRYSSYLNFFLFLPILVFRWTARILRLSLISENTMGSPVTNRLLYGVFSFERLLLPHIRFPFGVSLMAVCRKRR